MIGLEQIKDKMKNKIPIILFIFLTAFNCRKEPISEVLKDENGIIIKVPYVWKKSLHKKEKVSNSLFKQAVYYNGNIIIPTTNGGNNREMTLINPENGDFIWSWDDRYQPATEDVYIKYPYQYNNLLSYHKGDRFYCINMDNGTTYWKFRRGTPFIVSQAGLGDKFFVFGESETQYPQYSESVAYRGDIQTGNLEEFIIPDFTINHIAPGNRIGDVVDIVPYKNNNIQYLIVIWQEPQNVTSIYDWQTYLGLYNYDTNQWIYKKKIVNQPNINGVLLAPPKVYNDKIYMDVGKQLFCHDIMTGNQIWYRTFPQDFMFSGFIIGDGKIVANNEDTYTYCLNPDTGDIIWRLKTAGTSGRISYLNGIAYFVGGSDGRFYAIDVDAGKIVWRINVELLGEERYSSLFKTNAVYVFEAKNGHGPRVIALSHRFAYCFDAVR